MRKKIGYPNYILLSAVLILIILGILIMASVSAPLAQERFGSTTYFLFHQMIYGWIPGALLGFLVFKINLSFLKKWAPFLLLINIFLLGLIFLPAVGSTVGGAVRWINLGPISFQPSEFLKLSFLLYLASWLSVREEKSIFKKEPKKINETFIAFSVITGLVSLFLIFQPDISTLGVIVLTAILMYFLAKTPFWHSILIFLIGVGGLMSLIKIAPYRAARLLIYLKPEVDPMGMGYQIKQALIAVGSGGILGLGLGLSRQKFGFLPQSISDSIFAIFAEETGFIGSLILISLFLIFIWSAFKIAKKSTDRFSQLAALGISSWITLQAFINIGSMTGFLPLTGIPLPFISYGGSHLVAELVGVGILLNISRNVRIIK